MGIFFGTNCCGSSALVILLLPLQLLLYVATACTASFHTLSLAKSFLASVDKLSRTCNPALTKPGQESGSGAVFSHSSVLKHFGFDFSGLTSLGPPRSTLTSQVTELEAPVFINNKQCVLSRLGPKVNCEVQILLSVNQVLMWDSDLLFYLSRVSESKMSGFNTFFWIRFCGKPIQ